MFGSGLSAATQNLSIEWKEINLPVEQKSQLNTQKDGKAPLSADKSASKFKVSRLLFEPPTMFSNDEL